MQINVVAVYRKEKLRLCKYVYKTKDSYSCQISHVGYLTEAKLGWGILSLNLDHIYLFLCRYAYKSVIKKKFGKYVPTRQFQLVDETQLL